MPLEVEGQTLGVITVQSFSKNAYTQKEKTVLSTLASYAAIAISNANSYGIIEQKNHHITDSIRYAQTIQNAVLPKTEALETSFTDTFLIYKPKDIVSGDFYWHTHTNEHTQFVAVADCTGHGVPGAFMSMIGNTLLHEIININDIHDTAAILEELDSRIKNSLRQQESDNNDGMDIAICKIEQTDAGIIQLEFTGAKRPILWYSQETQELTRVKPTKRSIGGRFTSKRSFEKVNLELKKGDIVYLDTDGLADQAMQKNGRKIGSPLLLKLIKANVHLPLATQKENILTTVERLQGEMPQRDDITLMAFQV